MSDSGNTLQQQLRRDAEGQAERVLGEARSAAAQALAAVQTEHAKEREQRLQEAEREAEAQTRASAAGVRQQIQRRWLRLREEGLEGLFAAVLPQLEEGDGIDRERSLRQLLQEALEALGPRAVSVRLCPDSAALLSADAIAAVRSQTWPQADATASVSRVVDPSLRPGLRVESADGHLVFDNTYATRLERLRAPLRSLASAGLADTESDDDRHA